MKCPMRKMVQQIELGRTIEEPMDCLKEECAWWVDGEGGCVITFIEKDLAGCWTMLTQILNKMPHEE